MGSEPDDGAHDSIDGLTVEEAAEVVTTREGAPDPEVVRAVLKGVADDGVVSREGIEEALAETSKVVTTAESRTEFASIALADARETAEPVSDLDIVASRLDGFAGRLDALEARCDELGSRLQDIVAESEDPDDIYAVAADIRRLDRESTAVQQSADELQVDLESFETWVEDPAARFRELQEDADALGEAVDGLLDAIDELGAVVSSADDDATSGEGGGSEGTGIAWFDGMVRQRVLALLLADLRTELAGLRSWTERDDIDADQHPEEVESDLDDLEGRLEGAAERLDRLARPGWWDRFDDRLTAFEDRIEDFEPPVDWGEVQAALDQYRPEVTDRE